MQCFSSEAMELLEQAEAALLQLEEQPDNAECIHQALGAFHSVKGNAGMDGMEFLPHLMPQYPLPVVVVSALTQRGSKLGTRSRSCRIGTKPKSDVARGLSPATAVGEVFRVFHSLKGGA